MISLGRLKASKSGLRGSCGATAGAVRCVHESVGRLLVNQKHRPHTKRWTRYERLYQFTTIDDCTPIRILKVYDACNQRTAMQFTDEAFRGLPFRVHVMQTDNGAEFQSQFHYHLEALDIRHVYIRPRTPHLNGRSNDHIGSTTRSFINCWTRTAWRMTSTCSTSSCASGRTTTITTVRTGRSMAKPRTNG